MAAATNNKQFELWTPGPLDALRAFILSERFQSAVQLAVGILFVSLFVFVPALRFPSSCVAVLLYIVVAVTASPDNHVGTRIFICGFMIGPMWLGIITGGIVGTLAKLAPGPHGEVVVLSILGPAVLIPFAISRVGTRTPFLWAMGMVSTLYFGMPILAGFHIQRLQVFWMGTALLFAAAGIAMFSGSVLSMIVLPSLATHKLEDEVQQAIQSMGHHLSHTASYMFRQDEHQHPLPKHLKNLHPALMKAATPIAGAIKPGLLDRDIIQHVHPADVYAAVMDWFEHLSRPPGQQTAARGSNSCLVAPNLSFCRAVSLSSGSSIRAKSTFYGPAAAGVAAAAVAAAAADSTDDWDDADVAADDKCRMRAGTKSFAAAYDPRQGSRDMFPMLFRNRSTTATGLQRQHSNRQNHSNAFSSHETAMHRATMQQDIKCKDIHSSQVQCKDTDSYIVCKDTPGYSLSGPACKDTVMQPVPRIADIRQALAHAFQLLMAAEAEPNWLRGNARRFDVNAWSKVIAQSQQLALRLSGLDLIHRDHVLLLDSSHSLIVHQPLEALLKSLYSAAAAALNRLAAEVADRGDDSSLAAAAAAAAAAHRQTAAEVLQASGWSAGRHELLQLVEHQLVDYYQKLQAASEDNPVTLPSVQWVRQWMFFIVATLGMMDAVDQLVGAAAAALAAPMHSSRTGTNALLGQQQQQQSAMQQSSNGKQQQQQKVTCEQQECIKQSELLQQQMTIAAAAAAAAAGSSLQAEQQQQQSRGASARVWQFVQKHTKWLTPLLPLVANVTQFEHLKITLTQDVPRMFSSKQALTDHLKSHRFKAGLKYWFVCSTVLVSLVVLQHYLPNVYRYAPNFGYSAAAVGMSDRVESTMFKVFVWVFSSIGGAFIGWALMSTAAMANNALALAAVLCSIAFLVGSLGKQGNNLVILFTLMAISSVVLCQFVGCCGHTGSTMMAVVRGASVAAAALYAVVLQNLIWPWYTSSWALEQLGQTYREAADMLVDLVCQLCKETDDLIKSDLSSNDGVQGLSGSSAAAAGGGGGVNAQGAVLSRLDRIDAAVKRVLAEQQQQQQQNFEAGDQAAATAAAAAGGEAAADDVRIPVERLSSLQTIQAVLKQRQQQQQQRQSANANSSQAPAPAAAAAVRLPASSPVQLQARLLKPLVQVKMSLVLDATAWSSGPYATPLVVHRMLQCMFDVSDAIGALQQVLQTLSVTQLTGSWDWLLLQMAEPWGLLLLGVRELADMTAQHLEAPTQQSADKLLTKLQEVQHLRFEFFAVQRHCRRLLHLAIATEPDLINIQQANNPASADGSSKSVDGSSSSSSSSWQLEGQMRFSSSLFATAKVLDRISAVARCALEVKHG